MLFRRALRIAVPFVVLLAFGIQWVPVDRSNPPVETDLGAPPQVDAILRRACYDCHSNESVWPWYSRVAPVSWVIAHHVHEGRDELNFSTWNRFDDRQRRKMLEEIGEAVAEGEMPMLSYVLGHPEARLDEQDRDLLLAWARTASGGR